MEGLARETRRDRDRLLGVAVDGHYFVFVRYHQGHEPPLPVSDASCERLAFALSSGRVLIPENLVEDFGSRTPQLSRSPARSTGPWNGTRTT